MTKNNDEQLKLMRHRALEMLKLCEEEAERGKMLGKDKELKAMRRKAIEVLKSCEEVEEGKLSGEEFEKRITKEDFNWSCTNFGATEGSEMCT